MKWKCLMILEKAIDNKEVSFADIKILLWRENWKIDSIQNEIWERTKREPNLANLAVL